MATTATSTLKIDMVLTKPIMPEIAGSTFESKKGASYTAVIRYKLFADSKWIVKQHSTKVPMKGNNKRRADAVVDEIVKAYEADAERQIAEMLANEKVKGQKATISHMLKEWLSYINRVVEGKILNEKLDINTYYGYANTVENHIIPYLEKTGLTEQPAYTFTEDDILAYYADRMECGNLKTGGGLKKNSIIQHHTVLNQAFAYGVKKMGVDTNPCADVSIGQAEKYKADFFNTDDMAVLLEGARGEVMEPIIILTILFGWRRGEAVGLKWKAVDFVDNTVRIEHTVTRCRKLVAKDAAKNEASLRTYPMLDEVRACLSALKEQQERDKRLYGKDYQETEYVFRWPDGHPIAPDYVTHRYPKILQKCGLRHIRFHDLRHSCASMLLAMGYQLKDIAEWLGHSNIKTTANIYGHLEVARKASMGNDLADRITQKVSPEKADEKLAG